MEKLIECLVDDRIDAILRDLPQKCPEYAAAEGQKNALYEMLAPILRRRKDITICLSDCENFREYLDLEGQMEGAAQVRLYRQGYLDCVTLLRTLGVLA